MQPLAYLAVRALLGWLQIFERGNRAFEQGARLIVAAGAAHSWAVVYALFIAIHTRAMRYEGYHQGYTEHIPGWVAWTETLSIASMGIWCAAGFATAAIRIIDDDADGLPMEMAEVDIGLLTRVLRSRRLQLVLDLVQTASCVGLFASIVCLCLAMALMRGALTTCEFCLVFVAVGFALPHAAVAARHLYVIADDKKRDDDLAPQPGEEAAALEAAACGPQLCVILALADSPGHAYAWQQAVYLAAAVTFAGAVAACGLAPPKARRAALPPELLEAAACGLADAAAAASLILSFPHLNSWQLLWALSATLAAFAAAIAVEDWRESVVELIDPLLVVQSGAEKRLPSASRQGARALAWGMCAACIATAIWDVTLHPVKGGPPRPETALEANAPATQTDFEAVLPDSWSPAPQLLLRWRPEVSPDQQQLVTAAAGALGVDDDRLEPLDFLPDHRLFMFRYTGATGDAAPAMWRSAVEAQIWEPLSELADASFPAVLNSTLCLYVRSHSELVESLMLNAVGGALDAQAAYRAGCDGWLRDLESNDEDEDYDSYEAYRSFDMYSGGWDPGEMYDEDNSDGSGEPKDEIGGEPEEEI